MCSLTEVTGSYSKVELQTWCLWIGIDHNYKCIPGLIGSHELLCTFFRSDITSILEIYVLLNMRSLASVDCSMANVELRNG